MHKFLNKYPALAHVILGMSKIAEKDGLIVYMPTRHGRHQGAYIKVRKAEFRASFTIKDGILRIGYLPKKDQIFIQKYIENKRDLLLKAFDRAINQQDPGAIPFEDEVTSSNWIEAPDLLEVKALPGFILWGRFADGSILEWDIQEWIENSTGELFIPLKDFDYFSKVTTDGFLLSWPNGLDLDPDEFYEVGKPSQVAASSKE